MLEHNQVSTVLSAFKSRLILLGPVLVFLVAASCDDARRHEVMTYFFDGVPPLPGEGPQEAGHDPNAIDDALANPTGGWYVHEPLEDCTQCHGRRQRSFSREIHLVAQVPELCHQCHEPDAAGWVHGPVVTGECLFCHEPHKTKIPYLLSQPAPELCFQCHEQESVYQIERHAEESYQGCVDCHEGHTAETKTLLRPAFLASPAGATYLAELRRRQYEEARSSARHELTGGGDALAVLGTIIDSLERGQLWIARAYLEVALETNALSSTEKQVAADVLKQVVGLQEAQTAPRRSDADGEAPSAVIPRALVEPLRELRAVRAEEAREAAELYYHCLRLYGAGRLQEAREGFAEVLKRRSLPGPMKETARRYLREIEQSLQDAEAPGWRFLNQ